MDWDSFVQSLGSSAVQVIDAARGTPDKPTGVKETNSRSTVATQQSSMLGILVIVAVIFLMVD